MSLISIEKDTIKLNSRLDEYIFGKTKYNDIVTEKGIFAVSDYSSNGQFNFNFSDWSFSEIKSFNVEGRQERIVFYCGENCLSSKAETLLQLIQKNNKQTKDAYYALCCLLTQAAKENVSLPMNGPGGTIIDFSDNKVSILLIPENLFSYAANSLNASEYSEEKGFYLNPTLNGLSAICFQRSVYAYSLLCNRLPFTNPKQIERNADYLDRNFIPVEMIVDNLDKELSSAINKGLILNSNIVKVPGKKRKGKDVEDLKPVPDFPLELLFSEKDVLHPEIFSEDIEEKCSTYLKTKAARIKTKRTIRRNTQRILVMTAIFIGIFITIKSFTSSHLDDYCSVGLTAEQTIEAFFDGVNRKDVTFLDAIAKGKTVSKYIDTIGNIFVLGKQREAYSQGKGFVSPSEYLCYVTDISLNTYAGLYGITNLKIDGKLTETEYKLHKRKEKYPALNISEGTEEKHKISYYLLMTLDEENDIQVQLNEATVTLVFKKDCWIITDIAYSLEKDMNVNSKLFKADYFNAIIDTNKDILKSVQSIREKYEWLPGDEKIQKQLNAIEYQIMHPLESPDF
ncbi:MAG: hypothetical protein K6E97_08735 [Treponema sp.]|nr:hypothetical protein [Treponema sp.]